MLTFAINGGADVNHVRHQHPALKCFPFSSERKRMCTVAKNTASGGEFIFHCKGASEIVLAMCSHIRLVDGTVEALSMEKRKELEHLIHAMASDALRTICMAYRFSDAAETDWSDTHSPQMIVIGIVGIRDPVRPEVPEAVRRCQDAGVIVRMVTGDNKVTAKNIAIACGIYKVCVYANACVCVSVCVCVFV